MTKTIQRTIGTCLAGVLTAAIASVFHIQDKIDRLITKLEAPVNNATFQAQISPAKSSAKNDVCKATTFNHILEKHDEIYGVFDTCYPIMSDDSRRVVRYERSQVAIPHYDIMTPFLAASIALKQDPNLKAAEETIAAIHTYNIHFKLMENEKRFKEAVTNSARPK